MEMHSCKTTTLPGVTRRDFVGWTLSGALASLIGGPLGAFQARADSRFNKPKACILLWLDGGPSHIDTFDPKPGQSTGGPFRAISTSVPGVCIAEHLPRLAERMHDISLIRSLTNREENHHRAKYHLHTGYRSQESLLHPSLGSLIAYERVSTVLSDSTPATLPHYVSIGPVHFGAGFLGSDFDPLQVLNPDHPPEKLNKPSGWAGMKVFDINEEPVSVRQAYGETQFGAGCLLARRLVEAGVSFIEVSLPGWDTHRDNFTRTESLCRELDPAFAALLDDLKARELLDNTLVVCTGEFGRRPYINENEGREHHSHCWSAALAGGGVRGGQVIGATDDEGAKVVDRPVTPADLFRTCCALLDVNPDAQKIPGSLAINGQSVEEIIKTTV